MTGEQAQDTLIQEQLDVTRNELAQANEQLDQVRWALEDLLDWYDMQPDAVRWSEPAETIRGLVDQLSRTP